MKIIIKHIPDKLTRKTLQKFVERLVKPRWFLALLQRRVPVECRVMHFTLQDTGAAETHALVSLGNRNAALALIKRLNNSYLYGKKIEAHKYIHRSASRDHRIPGGGSDIVQFNTRRLDERRRPKLVDDYVQSVRIEGLDRFHKSYNGS